MYVCSNCGSDMVTVDAIGHCKAEASKGRVAPVRNLVRDDLYEHVAEQRAEQANARRRDALVRVAIAGSVTAKPERIAEGKRIVAERMG